MILQLGVYYYSPDMSLLEDTMFRISGCSNVYLLLVPDM